MTDSRSLPLVLIEWEDSTQPRRGWADLHSPELRRAVKIASVGWLVHDGDPKVLASTLGGLGGSTKPQMTGEIRIPAGCVLSVKTLTPAG